MWIEWPIKRSVWVSIINLKHCACLGNNGDVGGITAGGGRGGGGGSGGNVVFFPGFRRTYGCLLASMSPSSIDAIWTYLNGLKIHCSSMSSNSSSITVGQKNIHHSNQKEEKKIKCQPRFFCVCVCVPNHLFYSTQNVKNKRSSIELLWILVASSHTTSKLNCIRLFWIVITFTSSLYKSLAFNCH